MLLQEHYINIWKNKEGSSALFDKYKDEVWDILSKSYAHIGGVAGVNGPDDMVDQTSFWKLATKNGKVIAANLYGDKRGGRKVTAGGSDGTPEGKEALYKIFAKDWEDLSRGAWAEMSGKALGVALNSGAVPLPVKWAIKLLPDKHITPIDDYFYSRQIGAEIYVKCLVGNAPGLKEKLRPLTPEQIKRFKEKSKEYEEKFE